MVAVAIIGLLAAIAVPAYMTFMKKSKRSEAQLQLQQIAHKVVIYHYQHRSLPDSAGLFPTVTACSQPSGMVPQQPQSAWWTDPGWATLEFHIDDPTRFQYSWTKLSPTTGVASAIGDMDCDGVPDIFTIDVAETGDNILETHSANLDDI